MSFSEYFQSGVLVFITVILLYAAYTGSFTPVYILAQRYENGTWTYLKTNQAKFNEVKQELQQLPLIENIPVRDQNLSQLINFTLCKT